jgi:hypothetical protein
MTVTSRVKLHVYECKRVRWNRGVKYSGMTAGARSASQSLNHEGAGSPRIFGVKQSEYTLFGSIVLRPDEHDGSLLHDLATASNPLYWARIAGMSSRRVALPL